MATASDDPLHLVVEIKGYRNEDAQGKETNHGDVLDSRREQPSSIPSDGPLQSSPRSLRLRKNSVELIEKAIIHKQNGEHPDYEKLDFKELIAVAPLEGVDLARPREFPRDLDF